MIKISNNVKCDCGFIKKYHFNGQGSCEKSACTWFHPNTKYVRKRKNRTVV